jgi:dihydroorotate dehydrogenase (NAD+) catalytic subunit
MKLTVVGCSGSFPSADSACSSYLVEAEGYRLLLDLGNGALGELQKYSGLYDIDAVVISHLHPDHFIDMCGYFVARYYRHEGGRCAPIPVYGPEGTEQRLTAAYADTPNEKSMSEVFDFRTLLDGDSFTLGPLTLRNPLVTASGCFASGREINRFFDVRRLGAVVVKSVTLEPRLGLPTPRMVETPSGMLNAIGLQNPGVDAWLAQDLPWLVEHRVPTIVSIAGKTASEYRHLAERLRGQPGIIAIEANISCPNVEDRNIVFACEVDATREAVGQVVRVSNVPVFAKLTPDVTDITAIATAAVDAGATGLSLINTLLGMAIDVETGRPLLGAVTGGLSGPAIKPVAVRAVHQVHQALPDLPIVAMGGARTVEDVIEFVRAGASAVALGTAVFGNPLVTLEVLEALPGWLAARGHRSLAALRGSVVTPA